MTKTPTTLPPVTMDLSYVEKQRQALILRRKGFSYEAIAQEIGYKSKAGAFRAVHAAIKATLQDDADVVRVMELGRLDDYLERLQPGIERGDPESIRVALQIQQRRGKYLYVELPDQAPINPDGTPWHLKDASEVPDAILLQISLGVTVNNRGTMGRPLVIEGESQPQQALPDGESEDGLRGQTTETMEATASTVDSSAGSPGVVEAESGPS